MTTDVSFGLAERISVLERIVATQGVTIASQASSLARIDNEVSNNTQMIRALGPLVSQLAAVVEAQSNLKDAMRDLRSEWREDVRHFDGEVERVVAGQEREERDSLSFRRMLYGIGVAAVLSPIGTYVLTSVS